MLARLVGIALLIAGVYFLGQNITFTTNLYPYYWRGIAADGSILALTAGVVMLFFLPRWLKFWGWICLIIGIILVFMSSRAILSPTTLWQFFVSIVFMVGGYQLLTTGRLNL